MFQSRWGTRLDRFLIEQIESTAQSSNGRGARRGDRVSQSKELRPDELAPVWPEYDSIPQLSSAGKKNPRVWTAFPPRGVPATVRAGSPSHPISFADLR